MLGSKRKKLTINTCFFVMLVALFFILFVPLFVTHNENLDILYTATLGEALRLDVSWLEIEFLYVVVALLTLWLFATSLVYDKKRKAGTSLGRLFTFNFRFLGSLVFLFLFYVILGMFSIMIVQVDGNSMAPSLIDNQLIVIREEPRQINRQDIVLLEIEDEEERFYIKRVIGLPDEWVSVSYKEVVVNDKTLDESRYLSDDTLTHCTQSGHDQCHFSPSNNTYMVLGDNREESTDSRDFGSVYKQQVRGKMIMRLWPFW
ncbi:MAG: signal peptidase I [Bacillota bacterium]